MFNINPQYPYQQPYQQRPAYPPMPQYQPPQMAQNAGLKGRIVSSIDEVRAAQIDFDGSMSFFPCPATQTVFVKYIDNDGNAKIETFKREEPEPPKQYAEAGAFEELRKRFDELEQSIKGSGGAAK